MFEKYATGALFVAALAISSPAYAQDPMMTFAEGATAQQVQLGMSRIDADRMRKTMARHQARRGGNSAQTAACANRTRFSRQYGASHPKVRQLRALCARAGY